MLFFVFALLLVYAVFGQCTPSAYQNPALWEDIADIDVIRVNDTFYYSASSMHYSPGASILRSFDLVNWEFVVIQCRFLNSQVTILITTSLEARPMFMECRHPSSIARAIAYSTGVAVSTSFTRTYIRLHPLRGHGNKWPLLTPATMTVEC